MSDPNKLPSVMSASLEGREAAHKSCRHDRDAHGAGLIIARHLETQKTLARMPLEVARQLAIEIVQCCRLDWCKIAAVHN